MEVVEDEQEGARALFISLCRFLKNRWFLVRRAEVSVNWVGSCWWLPANDNNGDRGECEQQCTLLIFFFFLSPPSEKSANRRTVTTAAAVLLNGQPAAVAVGDTKHPIARSVLSCLNQVTVVSHYTLPPQSTLDVQKAAYLALGLQLATEN